MKRVTILITLILTMLLCGTNAFAGSIPEDLLYDDKSLLFFGELVSYDKNEGRITVLPTQKIKGDVNTGANQVYTNISRVGNFTPVRGTTYLMSYYDDNNPLYIFQITGSDTKNLIIEGIEDNGMWKRMRKALNEGQFEQEEAERLNKISGSSVSSAVTPTPVPTPTYNPSGQNGIYLVFGIAVAAIACGLILFLRKQKSKRNCI